MKNWIVILSIVVLASCKVDEMTVHVSNPSDVAHEQTTVEIIWADVVAKLPAVDPSKVVVVDAETGKELEHQIIYLGEQTPQMIIFQVTLAPNESIKLLIRKGTPKQPEPKTFGRFVPERKDDFAWENDRIAFRMYGPALAPENPSNGVDIWMKKTEKLIVDQFYNDDLNNNKSYHVDHGEGLDCYKVGKTLGCGGVAPFVNDMLWVGNHFVTHETLDNGPLRTTFRLTYDNLPVENEIYSKNIVISIDAGSQLNKAVVSFDGNFADIKVATGFRLPEMFDNYTGTTVLHNHANAGYIALSETATSDAGVPAGNTYVATVIPPDGKMIENLCQQDHWLLIVPYQKGERFTYYFGGGWSQWGFPTDQTWFGYVSAFVEKLKNPLIIMVE